MHPAAAFIIAMFGPHPDGRVYVASLPNIKGAEPGERHILSRSSEQIADCHPSGPTGAGLLRLCRYNSR
jgi:hypothetical protein